MDTDFWLQKWEQNEIAFHQPDTNPILLTHFKALKLAENSRIFVPLCGKSLDMAWFRSQGHHVLGVELSELAIQQLFSELGLEPEISELGPLKQYRADAIEIYVGDLFELSAEQLGPVHASYDRAALVALPEAMRQDYSAHLMRLTACAPQLLVCFDYDQTLIEGPPFSIGEAELKRHYAAHYRLTCLDSAPVNNGLKGLASAKETIWLLE